MLRLTLNKRSNSSPLQILCLGAHSDDIEIGCAGTLFSLIKRYPSTEVYWVVFSANGQRRAEAIGSAQQLLRPARRATIVVKRFKDSFFPYTGPRIKSYFEELKTQCAPDVVFTHYREDLHQDHRLISMLTWNTFRNHMILEYEIPKYDGDLGSPNVFVPLDQATAARKVKHILSCFGTQNGRSWFTEEVFRSLLRIRGMEVNARDRLAEAFYCRKLAL